MCVCVYFYVCVRARVCVCVCVCVCDRMNATTGLHCYSEGHMVYAVVLMGMSKGQNCNCAAEAAYSCS